MMKLIATPHDTTIIVALDATDCLALADACRWARSHDMPMDYSLLSALETTLELGALVCFAPNATEKDGDAPLTLETVRREWGMRDTSSGTFPVADPTR
jgi:hypothetical protein